LIPLLLGKRRGQTTALMSDSTKNSTELGKAILDVIREAVKEEIRAAMALEGNKSTNPSEQYGFGYLWWIAVVAVALLGLILSVFRPHLPDWIMFIAPGISKDKWSVLIAIYLFGIIGGHVAAQVTTSVLAHMFNLRDALLRLNLYPPAFVGFCEAVLYPTSFLLNKAEFIGVWLALKVAGQWKLWQEGQEGRRRFNRFLVGNAVSIFVAFITYRAIKYFVLRP